VKKVLCIGYREWALNIYSKIARNYKDGDVRVIKSYDEYCNSLLREYNPDFILFYGWSWVVDADIIGDYKCIMLHPSRLPKYRGGSPLQNQIIRGVKNSAVTLFIMNEEMDSGNIVFQESMSLSGSIDNIFHKIEELGYKGTMQFLNSPTYGVKQIEEDASYFKRRTEEQSEITLKELKEQSAEYIYNKIRMLQDPYPNAYFISKDRKKIIFKDAIIED
jgi:methionyl-tRNA formyltransferase